MVRLRDRLFRLTALRVRNYRILREFELSNIGALTVLVGQSGCGKSTLGKVIALVPSLAKMHIPFRKIPENMIEIEFPLDPGILEIRLGLCTSEFTNNDLNQYLAHWQYHEIEDSLRLIIQYHPKLGQEITDIFLAAIDSEYNDLSLGKGEATLRSRDGHTLPFSSWPDGWKAFLAGLILLRSVPSGSVLFFDTMKLHIDLRLLAQLLEQARLANQRGVQIFIATHSSELLNMIEPHELVLMRDGRVFRISQEKYRKLQEHGILLGDAWEWGILEDIGEQERSWKSD